jgi:CYTH domain-containing protein
MLRLSARHVGKLTKEIEVKYLIKEGNSEYATQTLYSLYPSVASLKTKVLSNGRKIRQGYLPLVKGLKLAHILGIFLNFKPKEARLRDDAGKFLFTLKGEGSLSRNELETRISKDLFNGFWQYTKGKRIHKVRLEIPYEGYTLQLDVYVDQDLIVGEIEIPSPEVLKNIDPLGLDVTNLEKYKNQNLAKAT